MAKGRKNNIKVDFDNLDLPEYTDLDYIAAADDITKNILIGKVCIHVLDEYVKSFSNSHLKSISVGEFLKAAEIIVKLKGFDESEADDLQKEIKLLLP